MLLVLFRFIISLAVLLFSSRGALRLLQRIISCFSLSEFMGAFVLLALATSLPEVSIGISSAIQGQGDVITAVALGSNVVNITLIMGLAVMLSGGMSTASLRFRRDLVLGGIIMLLPLLFVLNGEITRFEGMLLLLSFGIYLSRFVREKWGIPDDQTGANARKGMWLIPLFIIAVVVLLSAANYNLTDLVQLSSMLKISPFLLSILFLAIGTSLPELIITVAAVQQRRPGFILGNLFGSNVINSSLAIGIAAVIRPLHVAVSPSLIVTGLSVVGSMIILGIAVRSKKHLTIREGLMLLTIFVLFVLVSAISGIDFTRIMS